MIGALVLAVGALAVVSLLNARTAYDELQAAIPKVNELEEQVLAGDVDAAAATAAELQERTGAARDALHGPHWTAWGKFPWLGPNVNAAQTITEVVDDLATGALAHLIDAVQVVDPANLAPQDGRIDLAPIQEVADQVVGAHAAIGRADNRLAAVDTEPLVDQLTDVIDDLTVRLTDLEALTATAAKAVQLLPPMLGADGPRHYLLLVQNNAEPRATGGITGAVVLLRADDGDVEIVEQRAGSQVGPFATPVLQLDDAELGLYGTQLARYMQNVTFTPDFPRSAELAREMWRLETDREVDGVLSIDPVALQSMLGATGPITLATGQELNDENTAQLLLNQVYLDIAEPAEQDVFFQFAAGEIFAEVMDGGADSAASIEALVEVADEGRLMMWSSHLTEQELLSGTVLSGELQGHDGDSPVVGIYVNDRSGSKMGYYQRVHAEVVATQCEPDGSQLLDVTVTISSEAPADAAELPPYLAGGTFVDPGVIASSVVVYAPTGGVVLDATAVDGESRFVPQVHDGLTAVAYPTSLSPGESVTVAYQLSTGSGLAGDVLARVTPGPRNETFTSRVSQCDV